MATKPTDPQVDGGRLMVKCSVMALSGGMDSTGWSVEEIKLFITKLEELKACFIFRKGMAKVIYVFF